MSVVAEGRGTSRVGAWLPGLILAATVAQLAVATVVPIDRFEGKAFGARLAAYPVMMLVAPALWWLVVGRRERSTPVPWGAVALVMTPFLVDVTGNSLDLYDSVTWWDDANHYVNWLLLLSGVGLLVMPRGLAPLATVLHVGGLGAMLAIAWELGEWWTFIRHGTELATAYEDTLSDEALGTLGALTAGVLVQHLRRREDAALS